MNNFKILIFPAVLILAIISFWRFTIPLYQDGINKLTKDKVKLQADIQKEKELQQRVEKLSQEITKNKENKESTYYAVPTQKEAKSFIAQIENLSAREGMTIKTLRVEGEEESKLKKRKSIQESQTVNFKTAGSVELVGSYGQFKNVLRNFQKLERVNNIKIISINNDVDDESIVSGKYILGFEIYWQPELTANELQVNPDNTLK